MITFNYIITDEVGIHARPAGALTKKAKEFKAVITVTANGKSAEATKLMALMGLGVRKGTEVTISADGEDEDTAIIAMEEFFKANL